jgi:endonuclease/exonuclease/phosphatase family metal-dependent hydrolase
MEPQRTGPSPVRRRLASLRWVALGIALPWAWYLVRDLGPAMQLVAFALPVIVAAAVLGLIVAAFDGKRITTVLVALSVALFGWVTIVGPRSAQPSPPPRDPVRVATIAAGAEPLDAKTLSATIARSRAQVVVLASASKRTREAAGAVKGFDGRLVRTPFVILSRFPVEELPLAKGLPRDLVIRVQVQRPGGAFVVYGVSSGTTPLDATLQAPMRPDRLLAAIADEQLPVVLLGDLGVTDRSAQYRELIEVLRDAMRAGSSAPSTLRSPVWTPLLLRVDHVLTWASWCARGGETFGIPTSEHLGLAVAIGPCPTRG